MLIFSNLSWAQDSLTLDLKISSIKNQLIEEKNQFTSNPVLSRKQNDLLQEKHEQKIDYELALLKASEIVMEGPLFEKVNATFQQILKANPSIPQNTQLVICKSTVFNAFTMGDHVVFVHLGLLYSLKNDSEIALVLAHEIAHNTLKHVEKSLIESVKYETNDSLKREINSILRDEYGRASALNKLLIPRLMESREVSRNHEFSADSLGLIYIKNAQFNIPAALSMFEAMEDQTHNWSEPFDLVTCLKLDKFPNIALKTTEYSAEGSLGSFEEDEDEKPYLATHPYDRDRFVRLAKMEKMDTLLEHYKRQENENRDTELQLISKEILKTSLQNKNLTLTFYYACKHIEHFPKDDFGYEILTATLKSIGFFKERRTVGKYIMTQNPKQPEDLDRVCAFIYTLSPADCKILANEFSNFIINQSTSSPYASLIQLIEFMDTKKFDNFEALWLTTKPDIQKNNIYWILREVETHLYATERLKFLNPNIK